MNKLLPGVIAITFFFVANNFSQPVKKRPALKPSKAPAAKEILVPAEYEIYATVLKGSGIFIVGINPTPTYPLSNESSFQSFLNDHFGVKTTAPFKRQLPKVVIRFMGDDDVETVATAAFTARVSDKSVVELEPVLERGFRLIIAKKISEKEKLVVKPNPLNLVVEMNEKKDLTLNREEMGNLADMTRLISYLEDIYLQREKNAVFRENSNEIEKTIFIKMPLTAMADDLITIAKALETAGADRIGLQIDDIDEAPEINLSGLPPISIPAPKIPTPKKKPKR